MGMARDFFDLGNVKALFFELAADANSTLREKKIGKLAKGQLLPAMNVAQATQFL